MSTDRPLILMTSTRWPYLRDVLDILFLPSGHLYRFRYSPNFVPSELRSDPKKLVGRRGLVVHANTKKRENVPSGQYPYDELLELLPIREVTIEEVKNFGSFIWISFLLGDWVLYKRDTVSGQNEHHQSLYEATPDGSRDLLTFTLYETSNLGLQTIADDYTGESEEVAENWMRIVKTMARFPSHKEEKPTYLKLVTIKNVNCGNVIVPSMLSRTESGYNLRSGYDYEVGVLQYCPHEVEQFPLKLLLDEQRIVALVKEAIVFGRYDFLITSFRPIASLRPYRTMFAVEAMSKERMRLNMQLYAKVLMNWSRLVGAIAVVGGVVTTTIGPAILGGNLAVIGAIIAILGFGSLYLGGEKQ